MCAACGNRSEGDAYRFDSDDCPIMKRNRYGKEVILLADVSKPGRLLDLAVADALGYSKKEMAELFNTTPGAISKRIAASKRIPADNQDRFEELKKIILDESAREIAKLIAKESFERIAEKIKTVDLSANEAK